MSMNPHEAAKIKASAARGTFTVTNKASPSGDIVAISLYDEIGAWGVTAKDFMQAMSGAKGKTIELYVNSPGGDVFDGLAIRNQLLRHDGEVLVHVDGLAASAASFIATAGTKVTMGRQAQMMIHDAAGLCWGRATDMRSLADQLDRISDSIASIYAEKAGGDPATWRAVMQAETWYTAEEAVAAGLADGIAGDGENPEATNRFDLSIFAHAGRSMAEKPLSAADGFSNQAPPAEPEESTTTRSEGAAVSDTLKSGLAQRLGITASAELDDTKLLAALDEALAEQADTKAAPTGEPTTNKLPEGAEIVSSDALAELRAQAAAGLEAKNMLDEQRRTGIVDQAIRDGKITPATRDKWLKNIAESEQVIANILADMPSVVNTAPTGYTGGVDAHGDDDSNLYARAFGDDTVKEA